MGAWSSDSFGNDTACDWVLHLEKTSDLGLVCETIQKIVETGSDYLEASDAEEAIAAIEVIARLKGNFGERNSYTETVDEWVRDHPQQPSPDLVTLAGQALDRIMQPPSELLEPWQESKAFEGWRSSVLDLRTRASR